MNLPEGCMGLYPNLCRRPCAVGVDIRPNSWDVAIADIVLTRKGTRIPRLVFYGKLTDEEQVAWLLPKYGVTIGVTDSRPEATLAERLQKKMAKQFVRLWRASYLTTPSDIKISENAAEGILRLERTMTLDDVHYAFMTCGIAIPSNFEEICGREFEREIVSSSRVSNIISGREWWQWENVGSDHAFHALNYLLVAIHVGRLVQWGDTLTMGTTSGIVESSLRQNTRIGNSGDLDWGDDLDSNSHGNLSFTA